MKTLTAAARASELALANLLRRIEEAAPASDAHAAAILRELQTEHLPALWAAERAVIEAVTAAAMPFNEGSAV
jgi:hypothetical protein